MNNISNKPMFRIEIIMTITKKYLIMETTKIIQYFVYQIDIDFRNVITIKLKYY